MMSKRNWKYRRPLFSSPVAQPKAKKKQKWVILPIIWKALKKTCTAIGAMVLILAVYAFIVASQFAPVAPKPLPDQVVLFMNLEGGLLEAPPTANFADPFAGSAITVREYVAAIDKARQDERVKGIYARLEPGSFALAHVQELRDAIKRFKAEGKFAHIYAQSYGDITGGFGGYYLASSFDEIWMQPMGVVSITGLNLQSPYLRTVLNNIGITPNFFKRKEFKTAYENLTNSEMSPENREMLSELLADLKAEFMKDIPAERGFSSAQFDQLVDQGLFTAEEAETAKLITKADYADILVENIKEKVTGDREAEDKLFVDVKRYLGDIKRQNSQLAMKAKASADKPTVALVYAVGAIMPTNPNAHSKVFVGSGIAAADEIAPAILSAAEDEDVQAIVLRVDSPGGSPTASESILRAVEKAKAKGKPVIVSMGPTAASGGYWISAYADQIFALPTTITGSIGVVGGKFSAKELFEKLEVNWDGVVWGENANLWSFLDSYSPSEAERVNTMLDAVYDGFVERVAKGRNMTPQKVDSIAKGRVWSGSSAQRVGLVDQLGGLTEALNYTAQLLEKESKDDLAIVLLPKPKSPFEQFLELLGDGGSIIEGLKIQAQIGKAAQPLLHDLSVMQNPQDFSVYQPAPIQ